MLITVYANCAVNLEGCHQTYHRARTCHRAAPFLLLKTTTPLSPTDVPALFERFSVRQVVSRVSRPIFPPIFAHDRLRVQRPPHSVSERSPGASLCYRRRLAFAPASCHALECYTAEASVDLRSGCFNPTLPARAASFTASSRRATPATARSESSPAARGEGMSLDTNRRRLFGERGRYN